MEAKPDREAVTKPLEPEGERANRTTGEEWAEAKLGSDDERADPSGHESREGDEQENG